MAEQTENRPAVTRSRLLSRRAAGWALGVPAALALLLFIASFLLDEPLRRMMERNINRDLKGYSVVLPKLHVELIGLALTLKGLTIRQDAHPEPPVAFFPAIKASIHWREIFSGKLVAEFRLDRPKLNINLQQLHIEAASKLSLQERGWQRALEDIYPLKINSLIIKDASVTYIDQDPSRPLALSQLNLQAANIRNISLPDKVYPSSFHLDTVIFASGHGTIDGKANFLSEPLPAIKAALKLEKIPIDYFKPMLARSGFSVSGGVLGASGEVEYAPTVQVAHLKELNIHGMKIDYIHTRQTAAEEKKRAILVGKTARKLTNRTELLVSADELNLTGCSLGFVNRAAKKPYRLFLSEADFQLSNLSNKFSRGPAKARLQGRFMGSGVTKVTGTFRPEVHGEDFDLYVRINTTRLTAMNDLLRTYGDFDVSAGSFSLVTELHVKDDRVSGYIKPFFKDMVVYDRRKDKGKPLAHQAYEMLVGGAAMILENRSQQQVATKVTISGPLNKPETCSWQIIVELVKNAFFKAILPKFEQQAVGGAGKK